MVLVLKKWSCCHHCLQVGYFWTTLTVMCFLYSGIYRVALNLQRKSEAKHRKTTSLVMAGGQVSKIGMGVVRQGDDDDDESTSRSGRPRQQAAVTTGSKRNRPKQLTTTNTTVLLSPGPISNQVQLFFFFFVFFLLLFLLLFHLPRLLPGMMLERCICHKKWLG